MADTSVPITAGSGTPIRVLSGLGAGTADQQVVTLATQDGTLLGRSGTSSSSSVAASVTSGTLLAANTARIGATVANDAGGAVLYVLLGTGTASSTSYTVAVPAGGYYEVPFGYTGQIDGVWASASGNARITELT